MKKKLKCQICLIKINPQKDNWNKLETFTKIEKDATFYFHDKCYSNYLNSINYNNKLGNDSAKFNQLLERANLMLDNLGVDKIVEITK